MDDQRSFVHTAGHSPDGFCADSIFLFTLLGKGYRQGKEVLVSVENTKSLFLNALFYRVKPKLSDISFRSKEL